LVVVRECLEASALANGEVPDGAIYPAEHVLATGDAVVAGLERLRRKVDWRTRVAGVGPGTGLEDVVVHSTGALGLRLRQTLQSIADGPPAGGHRWRVNLAEAVD